MEILIISFDADPPLKGGVCTMTNIIAKELIKKGHHCTLGYTHETEVPSTFFSEKIKISEDNIDNILSFSKKKKFDVIITQFLFINYELLTPLKGANCKVISVYHTKPELRNTLFSTCCTNVIHNKSLTNRIYALIHLFFFPLFKIRERKKDYIMFNKAYNSSDHLVLLSESFIPFLQNIVPHAQRPKLTAIGNPIVFDETFPIGNLSQKEKKVLIVCNYNHVKRVPIMLKIWKEIEQDSDFNEWSLTFVGGGENFHKVINLAKKLKIHRIEFTGFKDPLPYYRLCSIMLMTSKYEGYPMVLLEGQQMGVVPIVYNSFESLTDIVSDRFNGIIIPNNEKNTFIQQLKVLMNNEDLRMKLAQNAITSSDLHSKEVVIEKYMHLFND